MSTCTQCYLNSPTTVANTDLHGSVVEVPAVVGQDGAGGDALLEEHVAAIGDAVQVIDGWGPGAVADDLGVVVSGGSTGHRLLLLHCQLDRLKG